MVVTPDTVVVNVSPDMSVERFTKILQDAQSPAAAEATPGYQAVVAHRVSPAFALSILKHESRFGTVGIVPANNLKNPGATRSTRTGIGTVVTIPNRGPFVRYPSWVDGWNDLAFRLVDPSFVYVKEGRTTIRRIIERWAPASDGNAPDSYVNAVVNSMNEWITETPMSLTDTIMQRIAAKGVEVHDLRGKLATSGTPETRPASAWRYTAIHHTAVSRTATTLTKDVESWQGHARYHVQTQGWPTIAYFIGVSLSGRVFILRDIEIVGYHAYAGANYQTLAVCGDMGAGNTASQAMLRGLEASCTVLHTETPELVNTLGAKGTYGHQELTFLDPQNQTGCPGALLAWTKQYRTATPATDPNARYFSQTGHWVVNDGDVKMLDLWGQLGGLNEPDPVGLPLAGMVRDPDGVYRQLCENKLLEWYPGNGGRSGGLGQRYAALQEQVGRVQLAVRAGVDERKAA